METIDEDDEAGDEEEEGGEDAAENEEDEEDEEDEVSRAPQLEEEEDEEDEEEENAVDIQEDDEQMFYRDVRATREMEDEFDKMFKQMMVESVNDRKASANVDAFDDVGVPLGFERAAPQVHEEDDEDDEEGASRVPTMHFQML